MNTSIIKILKAIFLFLLVINLKNVKSQVSEEWIHRYTGPESSTDTPSDFVTDESGNIYVVGKSILSGGFSDIITVKYNPNGVRQWIAKYNGPFNNEDEGTSIQVDVHGNVYVSGNTRTSSGQYNMITIKYNQSGVQQWDQQYNGPGDFDDIAMGIVIDSSGYIYTGGYSYGTGTSYDFVLLKYNSSGVFQWVQRWNGISNSDDYLKKISLASNGDIVVTGTSYDNILNFDFITLKYSSSGTFLWSQKYNGFSNSDDEVTNMKEDSQNNIYVCGKSIGTGVGYDYATVKYNSAGVQQWVARYNGPFANDDVATSVDVDLYGNVFVTGYNYNSTSYYDYATIKYNSSGIEQWIRNYNGVESYYDKAVDIKTDELGNVYVTGQSIKYSEGTSDIITMKYNSAGNVQWIKTYNGPGNLDDNPIGILVDKSGFLYIVANSYSYFFSPLCGTSDYLTLKYNLNGNFEWETRYDGAGDGIDEATSLAIDNNGNCYVTGFSYYNYSNFDYATVKYNSAGAPEWSISYDGGNGIDKPASIVTDNTGNIYVSGSSPGTGSGYDIATVKYNPNGWLFWEARYNGNANGNDFATGLVVDIYGNVYVTGYNDSSGSGKDYVTIKYNSSGVQQWASRYNGPGNSNDYSNSLLLDSSGNIYVTGKSIGNGTQEDISTIKYNPSGNQSWVTRYNGAANNSDEANSISIDKNGNIIVCGKSKSSSFNYDFVTIKYNSSGVQQWVSSYNGTNNGDDEAISLITDNNGNIYVTGSSNNISTNLDYTTIKYNQSGTQLWISNYNGTSNDNDIASSISIDLAGNLYVTGFCNDLNSNMNFCTIKYNNNGDLKWYKKYNYIDNDSDKASAVKIDVEGNVYVTGYSKGLEGGYDFATIKYKQDKVIELKSLIEGFYDELFDKMISDTMKIYLRNTSVPYNIVDSSISTLDSLGNGSFNFLNVQNGINYYIVLNHRNSLETWSSSGHSFQSASLSYDFTNSASQAYGNNLKQKGTKFCTYSGDVTKDGAIDVSDMAIVYNALNIFTKGYNFADVNGDNIVDVSDLSIVYNNANNSIIVITP